MNSFSMSPLDIGTVPWARSAFSVAALALGYGWSESTADPAAATGPVRGFRASRKVVIVPARFETNIRLSPAAKKDSLRESDIADVLRKAGRKRSFNPDYPEFDKL